MTQTINLISSNHNIKDIDTYNAFPNVSMRTDFELKNETSSHHEHTLYSESVFDIQNFHITNSLINSWIVVLIIVILSMLLRNSIKLIPSKIQNVVELIIESFLSVFDSITGSREKSWKLFPFIFTFFVFILLNNWMGILPWVGSVGSSVVSNGHESFIAWFRGGTADLNTTLALAIIAIVTSHIIGVMSIGIWNHFNKFINIKAILEIPSKVMKDPTILIVNPIKVFVGLLEIIGELAKVASLSFRLFGNIFAGEVLLASMSAMFAWGLPIPFLFMEILVGFIQALIFAILVLVYLSMSMTNEEH